MRRFLSIGNLSIQVVGGMLVLKFVEEFGSHDMPVMRSFLLSGNLAIQEDR